MRRSTDRILCTHGANLPRPAELDALLVHADENRAALNVAWAKLSAISAGAAIATGWLKGV